MAPPKKTDTQKPDAQLEIPAFLRRDPDAEAAHVTDGILSDTAIDATTHSPAPTPAPATPPETSVDVSKLTRGGADVPEVIAASLPARTIVAVAKIRKPIEERAVITMPVPTEDQLAEALEGVLPDDEFKLHPIDMLPSWLIKLAGREKTAILSTFSEQRRAHAAIMTGDEKIQKAVKLGLDNEKDGAAAFKGLRSLISSPTLNSSNPSTFRVLMKGAGQLGIAHPASLGEGAAITLAQQLHKKRVSDPLLGETLSDLGEIGTRSKKGANVAWPILNAYYQQEKIKGSGIPKFMSDSGTMADKWNSLRPDILPELEKMLIRYATSKDKGFLQAAFDAVKVAATQDPKAGVEICFNVQEATKEQAEFPKEILEDATIHFVAPLVDAQSLMDLFEREAKRPAGQPSDAAQLRQLLQRVDDSGLIAHRSRTPLVEAFDQVWTAHAFNEQSALEADQADFEADHDLAVIDHKRRALLNRFDNEETAIVDKRTQIIEDREHEISDRIKQAIAAQTHLFEPALQNG